MAGRGEQVRVVLGLGQRVAGVGGEGAEQIWAEHRGDRGAESAAGLARDGSVVARGERAVAGVDVRDDLFAQVGVVAAGAG